LTRGEIQVGIEKSGDTSGYGCIGKSVPRRDTLEKVLGEARYVADIRLPGMVVGKALRSKHAHALIKKIDKSAAERLPGIVKVVTARDIPGLPFLGRKIRDQPVISANKVKYIGDVVALVAAETEEVASKALNLIEVTYEELPAITDPIDAIKPGAPLVHEDMKSNILTHAKIRKGDIEEGFRGCDIVLENQFTTSFQDHITLEVECSVAAPGRDGGMDVWGSSDHPFLTRQNVARVLGLSVNEVHYHNMTIGGSFGSRKDSSFDVCSRTALLAYLCGRPVKMAYSREESITAKVKRHAAVIKHKLGAKRDGKLVACEVKVFLDTGVYSAKGDDDWGVPHIAAIFASGPYEIPFVSIDVMAIFTNNPLAGAMRGFGSPQVLFAQETQVDELARTLKMNPVDLRLKNALRIGSKTATGHVLEHSVGLVPTLERVAQRLGTLPAEMLPPGPSKKRGVGIACGWYLTGNGGGDEFAQALIYLRKDGTIELRTGLCDVGQGAKSVLAQICAQELQVPMDVIDVPDGDSDLDPHSMNTGASRVTTFGGNATIAAAQSAVTRLIDLASGLLCVPKELLEWKDGSVCHISDPEKSVTLEDLAKKVIGFFDRERLLVGHGFWQTACTLGMDRETGLGVPMHVYTFGTQAAIVDVDSDTLEIEVVKVIAAQDVGKAINPQGVINQLEGSVVMGVGLALLEEIVVREGIVLNSSLTDYLIPTSADSPEIECIIVEEPNELGPYGAKGIGEAAINPTAAAIGNAIYDACGIRMRSLPMTPDATWKESRRHVKREEGH
jgi:nicotinate dehydrogenase large molybdopterin subunit